MENELIIKHLAQIQSYLGWTLIVLIVGFVIVLMALSSIDNITILIKNKMKDKE